MQESQGNDAPPSPRAWTAKRVQHWSVPCNFSGDHEVLCDLSRRSCSW